MKNLRFIAMTGFVAFSIVFLGSQSDTFAQGRSGKSKGNSRIGITRSTDVIQRGIERVTSNRSQRNRNVSEDSIYYQRRGKYKNKRYGIRTNNGVRDHGRGIGRGNGQGKGRGYYKRVKRARNN